MKAHIKTLFAATAILFASCQEEALFNNTTVPKAEFTAETESYDPSTRTALSNSNVLWKQGDQVSIFAASTINEQYQVTDASDGQTSATLQAVSPSGGFNAGTELPVNIAYYPYSSTNAIAKDGTSYSLTVSLPATQTYAVGSFGNGSFPMTAVTSSTADHNLKFKNVLGGIMLQLKGTASIASISITGGGEEILCGTATVTASDTETPAINMTGNGKTVTLDCGTGVQLNAETATSFVIALPPMTMTSGFTVVVTDTDGKEMEIKTTKSQTITRSNLLKMPAVNYEGTVPSPTYAFVDLGLPSGTLWATMNVGATSPEDCGDFFAWGEINPKYETGYDWSNYAYCNGSSDKMSKYNLESKYGNDGYYDNKTILDMADDAANANWGGDWRMPTIEEIDELYSNCTWTWTTLNDVNGYKIQSLQNGYTDKWIFLPAAGWWFGVGYGDLYEGKYWSSSVSKFSSRKAGTLSFSSTGCFWNYGDKCLGISVRPVLSKEPQNGINGITMNVTSASMSVGSDRTLVATISYDGTALNTQIEWSSSNTAVAEVDYRGNVKAISAGTAIITAKTVFGGYEANCEVSVSSASSSFEYVDLGLSVKWATFNVGANAPEEYGDYFAWGATEPYYQSGYAREYRLSHWKTGKTEGYCWNNAPYQTVKFELPQATDHLSTKWSKYLGSTTSTYKDENATDENALKTVLDLSDDAAHVCWGEGWRMPTSEEIEEIVSGCSWTWTTINGVSGYKVQSEQSGFTDNWIFLPAAGWLTENSLGAEIGLSGFYWSSTVAPDYGYQFNAVHLWMDSESNYHGRGGSYRCHGMSVRPVHD